MNIRRTVGIPLVIILFAACGQSSPEQLATPTTTAPVVTTAAAAIPSSTATPTTTTTVTADTTMVADTTVAADGNPIDESAALTGNDWPAIIEILGRRRQQLYAQPIADDASYSTICATADGGACLEGLRAQIPSLLDQGLRIVGADRYTVLPDEVVVEDVEQAHTVDTARIVTVVVTIERSARSGQLVDDTGEVQADITPETPDGQNTRTRTTLVRDAPGAEWRILDQSSAGTVPA